MQKVGENTLAKKEETLNIIEHLLLERALSYDDYLTLNRLIEVLEREKVVLKLEEM